MSKSRWLQLALVLVALGGVVVVLRGGSQSSPGSNPLVAANGATPTTTASPAAVLPGMPPVVDRSDLYSETAAGKLSDVVKDDLTRIYVPNRADGTVSVIDPATKKVVDTFATGRDPQHVTPSWDLKTLWVNNNAEGRPDGTITPIDPHTGKPGKSIAVDDPYNLYFTPDGTSAVVVAEAFKRLDFRDPHSMAMQSSLATPSCSGINHADFTMDGRFVIFSCEFSGSLVKIDLTSKQVVGTLNLSGGGMPQDLRASPDGRTFYVAEMTRGGIYIIDPDSMTETGFIPVGTGTHGLYPSRDGRTLYVANRGSAKVGGPPKGPGSVGVLDFATNKIIATWPVPGGGSPDMGGVSADGKTLWLSGRYDNVVYAIDTTSGTYTIIPVGTEPHGLCVWPQPGRYSLGHTGNMR